ncbi:E3 ubiquitin-protein ligase RNF4-like [Ostrea edulis]|uniref:E3 ubiquitin-protein ligase RNF4-like n=1 Tax=Ostrea edulis TaxID=37623 RepID=UPI0024AED399|nr:E3 ubiquitin-protein ligase RNF4-like [Ostrea edulis]
MDFGLPIPHLQVSQRRPLHERRHRRRPRELYRSRSRHREHNQSLVILNDDDADVQNGSCIDLTSGDEDVIDLTSPNPSGSNDTNVVVLSGTSNTETRRRHRNRSRRNRNRDNSEESENDVIEISQSSIELPLPISFDSEIENEPSTSSNNSITSPLQEINCPICMDSKKQIQKSGRQLVSTVCGHVFCKPCIKASINTHKFCPTCRKKLTLRHIHPLFI